MNVIYIEDCLELLVSVNTYSPKFRLESSDVSFLNSIASQVRKGMALTERQYNAVVEKCLYYKEFFDQNEIDIDASIKEVRYSFREIDRRKEITIEHLEEWRADAIRIRFPFSKKQIRVIQQIKESISYKDHLHKKGSHEHFIKLTPTNLYQINKYFDFPNFDIQQEVKDLLDRIKVIVHSKHEYAPGIFNFKLKNFHPNADKYIVSRLGTPNRNNIYKFYDRRFLYAITHFDKNHVDESLTSCSDFTRSIVLRKHSSVWNKSDYENYSKIINTLNDLDRYPLFVLLPNENEYKLLEQTHKLLSKYVNNKDISVMFRLDNTTDENIKFNNYIKDNNLNNSLANNTKIVYTNNKITKPTLESGILPEAWLCLQSDRVPLELSKYMNQSDLIIFSVEELSPFNLYGYKQYDTI